jgi:hypothetical protein
MSDEQPPVNARAVGMLQALAGAYGNDLDHPTGTERGIVDQRAALDAVMQLFAAIDGPLQAGTLDVELGLHAMAMLMVVREHILPLPAPPGAEALLASDLRELVDALRRARNEA